MNRLRLFAPIVTDRMADMSGRPRVADGRVASRLQILFADEATRMACFAIPIRRPPRNMRTMRRWSSCASDPRSPPRLHCFIQDIRT